MSKGPLAIFVLWHPSFPEGQELANLIFTEFKRNVNDPLSRGMNIPVYFRFVDPLLSIPTNDYEFTVVVALVESGFVIDNHYNEYLANLANQNAPKFLLIPCAMERTGFNLKLGKRNFARLYERENKAEYLIEIIAHETVRHLYGLEDANTRFSAPPPPLKLFISHAKVDGLGIAS